MKRRTFLQRGALAGAAAALTGPGVTPAAAQAPPPFDVAQGAPSASRGAQLPPPVMTAAAEATPPADVQVLGDDERCGSDYMVDVIKSLGFDYVCANPGSSFRGLHE